MANVKNRFSVLKDACPEKKVEVKLVSLRGSINVLEEKKFQNTLTIKNVSKKVQSEYKLNAVREYTDPPISLNSTLEDWKEQNPKEKLSLNLFEEVIIEDSKTNENRIRDLEKKVNQLIVVTNEYQLDMQKQNLEVSQMRVDYDKAKKELNELIKIKEDFFYVVLVRQLRYNMKMEIFNESNSIYKDFSTFCKKIQINELPKNVIKKYSREFLEKLFFNSHQWDLNEAAHPDLVKYKEQLYLAIGKYQMEKNHKEFEFLKTLWAKFFGEDY